MTRLQRQARAALFIVSVAAPLAAVHLFGAQMGMMGLVIEHTVPGAVSAHSWKRCAENPDHCDAYSAYNVLSQRRSPVARDIARAHLESPDPYLWLNAAMYLGAIGDEASVPYLIKAFRHRAHAGAEERAQLLAALTGQDFGVDFDRWRDWWLAKNPDGEFDWTGHLESPIRLDGE